MDKNIYKSAEGRNIIEAAYKNILIEYSPYPYEQIYAQTKIAQTHVLKFGDETKPPLIMIHGSASNSATSLCVRIDVVWMV